MAWALSNRPELSLPALWPIVLALVTCLCGNIYIVGLNQLEDVEIDRINKPHLPLASGEFSLWQGWVIVGITGLLALVLSLLQGPFLAATVWLSVLIGTAYSLSPIRLKRFPFWASLCIFTVRGAIVNLGLFLHFRQVWNSQAPLEIPPTISALTLFILVFTFAIAILKDVPDLEGDRLYCISTFTVRLGGQTVFNLARWVLTLCYGSMILAGNWITGSQPEFLVISHLLLVIGMWWRSWLVDLSDRVAIARFYQFVWKLFFLEYLIFSAACLLVW
jgi:homogentisate phytyltransferase/homogentisate geranylgeranyltransferase